MRIILLLILSLCLTFTLSAADCGTPVECYTLAINKLEEARQEYRKSEDNLKAIIAQLGIKVESNKSEAQKNYENSIQQINQVNSKVDKNWEAINSQPKAIYDVSFHNCDGANMLDCHCPDGKKLLSGGCNTNTANGILETSAMNLENWRCRANGNISVRIICARIPY